MATPTPPAGVSRRDWGALAADESGRLLGLAHPIDRDQAAGPWEVHLQRGGRETHDSEASALERLAELTETSSGGVELAGPAVGAGPASDSPT